MRKIQIYDALEKQRQVNLDEVIEQTHALISPMSLLSEHVQPQIIMEESFNFLSINEILKNKTNI